MGLILQYPPQLDLTMKTFKSNEIQQRSTHSGKESSQILANFSPDLARSHWI